MKYVALILIVVVVLVLWPKSQPLLVKTNHPQPSPSLPPSVLALDFHQKTYHVYLQKISPSDSLTLIPNFAEKKSSQTLMRQNNCNYGINGGFYTQGGQPLGVFYINGKFVNSQMHTQTLFNGFIYGNSNGLFGITDTEPNYRTQSLDFYFQTGPFFTPTANLRIQIDELARRVLIGESDQAEFYFIAITDSENINSGPPLADLPEIMGKIDSIKFLHLVNLDGGSASAFYNTAGEAIGEIVSIGSFLCAHRST